LGILRKLKESQLTISKTTSQNLEPVSQKQDQNLKTSVLAKTQKPKIQKSNFPKIGQNKKSKNQDFKK
jgi:hypothetical protein